MAKLKKKIPDGFTDLCYGRSNGPWTPEEIERCKTILSECELDATYAGSYKYTALHQTALPLEIVEWLVERGADVNAPNTYGTPLEDTDIKKVQDAALEIDSSKGCCSEEPVELLEEMAVKWVSLNSNPIQLGRVSYKR